VARNLLESFPDGAWIAELAPLADPGLVPQRVASALGVREEAGRPILETLHEALGGRALLILLDNCEHLTEACRSLATSLLESAPGVRLLATSREPLGVAGEVVWRVPPLHVPDVRGRVRLTRREIGQFESVRLFAERAAAAAPNFSLTDQNAELVAQICARLDGIPLAIELAAARVKVLPVNQVLSRLEDRFRLLTSGSPTALHHQQTLRATVEWSYDLLSEKERTLFDRLSVFAGGASLEAVESICAGASVTETEILDLLTHLIDKSLVLSEEGVEGAARYRMLETLREYGREALEGSGAKLPCLERHARFYLALAEEGEGELTGSDQSAWLARLEQEHDNLRRSAEWAVATEHAEEALRLAGSLWRFWRVHGHFDEGRRRLNAALALGVRGEGPSRFRAKALLGSGALARSQSDYERAQTLLEESLTLLRGSEDLEGVGAALQEMGNVADDQGRHDDALARYQESLAIRRRLGDRIGEAALLHNLGVVAQAGGDHERARSLYQESLAIKRELGNEAGEANTLNALGSVAFDLGDHGTSRREHEQALALHRRLRHQGGIAYSLHELGRVAIATGDFGRARTLLRESLPLFEELGDRIGVAETLEHFAVLAIEQGAHAPGLELAGAASAIREQLGAPATPTDRSRLDSQLLKAREILGDGPSESHLREGSQMKTKDALALAVEELAGTRSRTQSL
jgi:non-specific serine/threonine protein kinase